MYVTKMKDQALALNASFEVLVNYSTDDPTIHPADENVSNMVCHGLSTDRHLYRCALELSISKSRLSPTADKAFPTSEPVYE